jgi:hypothetical protein
LIYGLDLLTPKVYRLIQSRSLVSRWMAQASSKWNSDRATWSHGGTMAERGGSPERASVRYGLRLPTVSGSNQSGGRGVLTKGHHGWRWSLRDDARWWSASLHTLGRCVAALRDPRQPKCLRRRRLLLELVGAFNSHGIRCNSSSKVG